MKPARTTRLLLTTTILLAALTAATGQEVKVTRGTLTLPWYEATQVRDVDPGSPRACGRVHGTERLVGSRPLKTVTLETDLLRVTVLPENGGSIARAIHKPTGDDFFFYEGKAKNWLPYWESGVKVSFPFREHGIGLTQPTGWHVMRHEDGSVTLAMWMEFTHHDQPYQRWIYGRYSNMLLSQHVTVRPGESTFTMTFRIVNPTGYRQGRRLWSDVLFPRNHTAEGAVQQSATPPRRTDTEAIMPAAWVSSHNGSDLRRYGPTDTPLAKYDRTMSIFAWDIGHGFAGYWYPTPKVSRLLLFDPRVSPGVKQWFVGEGHFDDPWWFFKYNLVEIWGGSDNVFEGVEHWLEPGESYQFTQRYAVVRGIGKVHYANANAAVHAEFGGDEPQLQVVTFRKVAALKATLDGKPLGSAPCAPDRPAGFRLPADANGGLVVLRDEGKVLLRQQLPLVVSADKDAHAAIHEALKPSPQTLEKCGNNAHWGEMYRAAIGQYPDGSLGRGRLLYRDGYLPAAVRCLAATTRTKPQSGEAWHLLGVARLEQGKTKAAR
ncbi:MAG: tetratricopeptide repeat protein, partial [Phycisphaerae bacterium]